MANIFDANEECCFEGMRLLFDTNIWITIYGNDPTPAHGIYSNYYSSALKRRNSVLINDTIISEYFNRACKIEYELLFGKEEWPKLKERRRGDDDYRERVESVRDTCLHILEDCEYVTSELSREKLETSLEVAAEGTLDITDSFLIQNCADANLIFVSHDGDFANVDCTLVTANQGVLRRRS